MSLTGKIFVIVLLVGLFFMLEIFPRIVNKKLVNDDYINSIKEGLKFKNKGKDTLTGFISGFYVELYFIVPTTNHLKNDSRIRISMNYKPSNEISNQEIKVNALREKHPEFDWVANCLRKDLTIDRDGPKTERIKKELSKMESVLLAENLSGISEQESDEYGGIWDGAM